MSGTADNGDLVRDLLSLKAVIKTFNRSFRHCHLLHL
jgi:hypothetical protein